MSRFETRKTQNPKSCASASSAIPAVVSVSYKLAKGCSTGFWYCVGCEPPMRRMLTAAGIALLLHTLAFFFLTVYRDLAFEAGRPFCHATDIADLGCIFLFGFIILAIGAAAVGILFERLDRILWRTDSK